MHNPLHELGFRASFLRGDKGRAVPCVKCLSMVLTLQISVLSYGANTSHHLLAHFPCLRTSEPWSNCVFFFFYLKHQTKSTISYQMLQRVGERTLRVFLAQELPSLSDDLVPINQLRTRDLNYSAISLDYTELWAFPDPTSGPAQQY